MQDNIEVDMNKNPEELEGYQVIVTNITWSKDTVGKFRSKKDFTDRLPDQMSFNLPDSLAKKDGKEGFKDEVETFTYNFLTKRFNHEVYSCQIWLPCEEQNM